MPIDTLQPKQVAASLDVSVQTLRRWAVLFEDYLSDTAKSGRRRRVYTSVDVATLRLAGSLIAQGMDASEIRLRLARDEQPTDTEANMLIIAPELARELQDVKALNQQLLSMLADSVSRFDDMEARIAQLEARGLRAWLRGLRGG